MDTENEMIFFHLRPRICNVCNRLCILRCFCCDTIYCSAECLVKDLINHGDKSTAGSVIEKEETPLPKLLNEEQSFKLKNVVMKNIIIRRDQRSKEIIKRNSQVDPKEAIKINIQGPMFKIKNTSI